MKYSKKKNFINLILIITILLLLSNSANKKRNTLSDYDYDYEQSFTILSANVGNRNLICAKYLFNLCLKFVEENISSNIKELKPDIVILQELLSNRQINDSSGNSLDSSLSQVRRILGNQYTIICDTRNQYECIGVHIDFGEVMQCKSGDICYTARTLEKIEDCDSGFTVSAVTVTTHNGLTFDVVNVHLQSNNTNCQNLMLDNLFSSTENKILQGSNIIIAGDFNFDPWRDNGGLIVLWNNFLINGWKNKKLSYQSEANINPEEIFTTSIFFFHKTYDFIVSNFSSGKSYILGLSPNTKRLDDGYGMDHYAIFSIIQINE